MINSKHKISTLYRDRPINYDVVVAWIAILFLIIVSWYLIELDFSELFSERRVANIKRLAHELIPYPMQVSSAENVKLTIFFEWALNLLKQKGFNAIVTTFWISILSIILASLIALPLSFLAAKNLKSDYFLNKSKYTLLSLVVIKLTRFVFTFVRSIPEYIWAFILLAIFGPSTLPAILALAIHNSGILGKLNAEVIEDMSIAPVQSLRFQGASLLALSFFVVLPSIFLRFLALVFYRWETCVRESTVLGMLGIYSLGYWVEDSRARNHYDEMFFYILCGLLIVVLGDIISVMLRYFLRARA